MPPEAGRPGPTLRLSGVGLTRDGRDLLDGVDWEVRADERWVVIGANGSGKTSLARIATLWEHPSRGTVEVLGQALGRADVRSLRRRLALVSAAMADLVRPSLPAADVVMSARHAALEPWWHRYTEADRERARALLAEQHVGHLADHPFGTLSSGERQRTLLARALMGDPELVVLDEPAAGLDLGGREELIERLDRLAATPAAPPVVLVTHHVEEIPPSFTHVIALRQGRVLGAGPIAATLDADLLGRAYGLAVELDRRDGRFAARRAGI
jgi:iron complex transport system ATP-binding protein